MLDTPAASNINIRPSADGQSFVDALSTAGKPDDGISNLDLGYDHPPPNPPANDKEAITEEGDSQHEDTTENPTGQNTPDEPARSPVFLTETEIQPPEHKEQVDSDSKSVVSAHGSNDDDVKPADEAKPAADSEEQTNTPAADSEEQPNKPAGGSDPANQDQDSGSEQPKIAW